MNKMEEYPWHMSSRPVLAWHTLWKCWVTIEPYRNNGHDDEVGRCWIEKTKTTIWPESAFEGWIESFEPTDTKSDPVTERKKLVWGDRMISVFDNHNSTITLSAVGLGLGDSVMKMVYVASPSAPEQTRFGARFSVDLNRQEVGEVIDWLELCLDSSPVSDVTEDEAEDLYEVVKAERRFSLSQDSMLQMINDYLNPVDGKRAQIMFFTGDGVGLGCGDIPDNWIIDPKPLSAEICIDGTIASFEIVSGKEEFVMSGTVGATGSGADMELDMPRVFEGQQVTVSQFTLSMAQAVDSD